MFKPKSASMYKRSSHYRAFYGYLMDGYGVKSLGLADVSFALPPDALAAASNPGGTGLDHAGRVISRFPRRSAAEMPMYP
jgi:hypothetical protein